MAGTYLKVNGPIPISIEGIEEEVRVGGGVWGKRSAGELGLLGSPAPTPCSPAGAFGCVPSWGPPFQWDRGNTRLPES